MRIPAIPAFLLILGLAATGVGLARQTETQAAINQRTGTIVADLVQTRGLVRTSAQRLLALETMDQGLVQINSRLIATGHALAGAGGNMRTLVAEQTAIFHELAALNHGLSLNNTGLAETISQVSSSQAIMSGAGGILPTTASQARLMGQLNTESQTTIALLAALAQKFAILRQLNRVVP